MARLPTKRSVVNNDVVLDVSNLSEKQRTDLQAKLKALVKGVAPDANLGSLVGAEGGHVSHNDTDGWF